MAGQPKNKASCVLHSSPVVCNLLQSHCMPVIYCALPQISSSSHSQICLSLKCGIFTLFLPVRRSHMIIPLCQELCQRCRPIHCQEKGFPRSTASENKVQLLMHNPTYLGCSRCCIHPRVLFTTIAAIVRQKQNETVWNSLAAA